MHSPGRPRHLGPRLAALGVLLVALLNGAGYHLGRIGVLEPRAHQSALQAFCRPPVPRFWLPARCSSARLLSRQPLKIRRLSLARLHHNAGPLRLLKLAKLLLLIGIVAEGARRWWRRGRQRARVPSFRQLRPAVPLLASTGLSLLISATNQLPWLALASLVPAGWLLLIVLGGWLSTRRALACLAVAVALVLVAQLPLVGIEAMRGLPMSFGPLRQNLMPQPFALPTRLAGSFVHPNSLGAAAVLGFGFCLSYLRQRRWLPGLWIAAVVLSLAARSGAGLVGAVVLLLCWLRPPRRLLLLVAALGTAVLLAAPQLLGRPDLWNSLTGRFTLLAPLIRLDQPLHLLFGQGLAAFSNQLASLLGTSASQHLALKVSDGMPVLLLLQGGLLALAAFYGLLLWAWRADPCSRPFLLAAFLISLVLNITELAPFGLLLALSLNRALLREARSGFGHQPAESS